MKIAVVSECSTCSRNAEVVAALSDRGQDIFNLGASEAVGGNLLYIHTALMSSLLLESGQIDLVVGGCGTGQGFMIAANQLPAVYCGLLTSPLDAWLFARINAGNAVSLQLNQGYGWAGQIQLGFIFDRLFASKFGEGFPPARRQPQQQAREQLTQLAQTCKRSLVELLPQLSSQLLQPVLTHPPLREFLRENPPHEARLRDLVAQLLVEA